MAAITRAPTNAKEFETFRPRARDMRVDWNDFQATPIHRFREWKMNNRHLFFGQVTDPATSQAWP